MRTCDRTLLLEAGGVAAATVGLSAMAWPGALGLDQSSLHPAWLGIVALAARYGPRGLYAALVLVLGAVAAIAFLGSASAELLLARLRERTDLWPLATAVAAAWVAMGHESRMSRVSGRLDETTREHERTARWAAALGATTDYLRSRCDRIDVSVTMWRRVARCLEGGDTAQAADAALELCMVRTGATSGCVARLELGSLQIMVEAGASNVPGRCPPDLTTTDTTARAAVRARRARVARDLPGSVDTDSDVAVPVLDKLDGDVLAVIALRGVDPARLRPAEVSDLELIAEWLSPGLARQVRGPRLRAVSKECAP